MIAFTPSGKFTERENTEAMLGRHGARRRLSFGFALSLWLAGCGAVGTPSNPEPPEPELQCRSLEESLPNFLRLLRDPASPLSGLKFVVTQLNSGDPTDVAENPIASMLKYSVLGLSQFTKDQPENGNNQCFTLAEYEKRAASVLPLCGVEARLGEACENRMCVVRRALTLGLQKDGAKSSLDVLEPVLGKVLGYMSNTGPGADGKEHYEVIEVLHRTAVNESLCEPKNLVDVVDGIVVYFRNSASCGKSCPGLLAAEALEKLVRDPELQALLNTFESAESDGSGREAFQALGRVLGPALASMPEDDSYFQPIQRVINLLYSFMDGKPRYDRVRGLIEEVVVVLKGLLDPNRPGAILKPFKAVMNCVNRLDEEQALVGAAYDLLSRSGDDGQGLDVDELVTTLADMVRLDANGVFFTALHSVLATLSQDEPALEAVRQFLVQVQTVENARLALPAVQKMVQQGVVEEILSLLNELLYGCKRTM